MADSLTLSFPLFLSGFHILQMALGCEWDDETGEVNGFSQVGYDGEDFVALEPNTMMCVAVNPQAAIAKHLWGRDEIYLDRRKTYYNHECPERLKSFLKYLNSFLQRAGTIISSLIKS